MKLPLTIRLFTLLLLLGNSGCIFAPTIDSVKRAGLTAGDRENILPQTIESFHQAIFWGNPTQALGLVSDEYKSDYIQRYRKRDKDERIWESKVDLIEFADNSYTANVDVRVRYYKIPYLVVKDRLVTEVWKFSLIGGWKISSETVQETP